MLCFAASFVIAVYEQVRLIPQNWHALPAELLRSRPEFKAFAFFYEPVIY
jgi:hypothetical protein